jgi:outer membrane protein OmpA-like peptidoglycan-associated protein
MPTPKTGEVKTWQGIFFATGKSDIMPQSYNALQHLLELLRQHPDVHIELRGHTDNQGTADFNMRLSLARAEAVANYLIERGINAQRLSTQGFGKTMPIDSNDTPEGRSKNRRVEYQVIAN